MRIDFYFQETVSLFGVSKDGSYVSFIMTRSDMDVYSSDEGPFMYITQFKLATHIITMDMETFRELADNLPEKKDVKVLSILPLCLNLLFSPKIMVVANTGRCGSTLLAQMFEAVKG